MATCRSYHLTRGSYHESGHSLALVWKRALISTLDDLIKANNSEVWLFLMDSLDLKLIDSLLARRPALRYPCFR